MEPHPGTPWQQFQAIQNPRCCTNSMLKQTLWPSWNILIIIMSAICNCKNNKNNYSNKYIIHSPTAVSCFFVFFLVGWLFEKWIRHNDFKWQGHRLQFPWTTPPPEL